MQMRARAQGGGGERRLGTVSAAGQEASRSPGEAADSLGHSLQEAGLALKA